jgi:hypothetical protein
VENLPFRQAGFDWDGYIKHRPTYPSSLYQRIYEHHYAQSGGWELAHDVGAGPGVVSQEVEKHFRNVVISDPNEDYINIATHRLSLDFKLAAEFKFLRGANNTPNQAIVSHIYRATEKTSPILNKYNFCGSLFGTRGRIKSLKWDVGWHHGIVSPPRDSDLHHLLLTRSPFYITINTFKSSI